MGSNFAGLPHFSRTSLWLIIAILFPLIAILNRTSEPPATDDRPGSEQLFNLESLNFSQQDNNFTAILPGSGQITISIATKVQPVSKVKLPDHQDFSHSIRNNYSITQVSTPAEQAALEVTLEFLYLWLPPLQADDLLILSGDFDDELAAKIRDYLSSAKGDSILLEQPEDAFVSRIQTPPMGTSEQLAFLIATDIMRGRMSGYNPKLQWDHSDRTSYLNLNLTVLPEWLKAASDEEITTIRDRMIELASQKDRTAQQIHRYLATMALYGQNASFIQQQATMLAAVTPEQVNQQLSNMRNSLK